jgi:hypothetical protein
VLHYEWRQEGFQREEFAMTDYTVPGWGSITSSTWSTAVSRFRSRLSFTIERAEFRPRFPNSTARAEWFVVPTLDDAPLPGWEDDESFGYWMRDAGLSRRPGSGFRTRKAALADADRLLDYAAELLGDSAPWESEVDLEMVATVMAS